MDVAALVISIFAVLLSLIVAGFAIGLQWRMFNATSQQLNLIGKENASLGERIAASLGQLHETASITRSRLDATLDQLVSGLLGRAAPSAEGAGAEVRRLQPDPVGWRIEQAAMVFELAPAAPAVLEYLAGDGRDTGTLATQLFELRPESWDKQRWEKDVVVVASVLVALDLLDIDAGKNTVSLRPEAKQIAARLSEAKHD